MVNRLGPEVRGNTSRPAAITPTSTDTWWIDCVGGDPATGTAIEQDWHNKQLAIERDLFSDVNNPAVNDSILTNAIKALVQQNKSLYAPDTGAANGLIIALSPAPIAGLTAGFRFWTKIAADNTGACTVVLNGAASVALVRNSDGTALQRGDLRAAQTALIEFDGALYRLYGLARSEVPTQASLLRLNGSSVGGVKTATWTADQLVALTSLGGNSYYGSALNLSFDGATTGAGGMDTGTMPSGADLSVYAIYNPTTNTWSTLGCAGSVSHASIYGGTHMPAGFTASILIYAGVTISTNFNQFQQVDRLIYCGTISVFTGGINDSTFRSFSIATAVPVAARTVGGAFGITASFSNTLYLAGNAAELGVQQIGTTVASSAVNGSYAQIPLITPQTLFYEMVVGGTASAQVYVSSYGF